MEFGLYNDNDEFLGSFDDYMIDKLLHKYRETEDYHVIAEDGFRYSLMDYMNSDFSSFGEFMETAMKEAAAEVAEFEATFLAELDTFEAEQA